MFLEKNNPVHTGVFLRFFENDEYARVPYLEHPNRCKAVNNKGQCLLMAMEGKEFCKAHIGGQIGIDKKRELKKYRLRQWNERVSEFANDGEIKSLNEEIGILRLTLETTLNSCEGAVDLIANSSRIQELVTRLQKLIDAAYRIEKASGLFMDKASLIQVAGEIIKIIGEHVEDSEVFKAISEDILTLVNDARSTKTDS